MAAAHILNFTLWMATVFTTTLSCPERCTCSVKYGRHVAECSYKDMTEVPKGLHSNITTVSLSANKISLIPLGSFDIVTQVSSLWMAHNEIVFIEQGSLAPLVHLRNFDISHNKIKNFPWKDLQNLTALHLLKLNHNELTHLPTDAFSNLKHLRSLQLNNNKFITIAEGTFDSLVSLSHLQIYNNPFVCTCSLDWLKDWISKSLITVPDKNLIICNSPEKLRGKVIMTLPKSKCQSVPNVTLRTEPNIHTTSVYEDSTLILTCEFKGKPKPLVMWSIHSKSLNQELPLLFGDESHQDSDRETLSHHRFLFFNNGTLIIPYLREEDDGNYSCTATNELGKAEDSVLLEVLASPKPTPKTQMTTTPTETPTNRHQPTDNQVFVLDTVHLPATIPPIADEEETRSHASKCDLTANTRYISSHVFNGSLDNIKQYTFDFGVIAIGVSETEATVQLNCFLIPRKKSAKRNATADTSVSLQTDSRERNGHSDTVYTNGLYLCITSDRKHSAVQWSRIKDDINTYRFSGLRPGTNYSLCLTYRGEDCEVQVLFTTRRSVPNLVIIISVSICLLTMSTVPLLGATCFHLVYKYRSKTFKLILKAKDQYHMERNLTANLNIHRPHTESQRKINVSQLDEEEEGGDREQRPRKRGRYRRKCGD
ncbi:immunoglobulin superfamily containing leucine-rich repeat protein 2-like [Solea senegalensis]|nr:immunoglobulin superfamily containing leucine-rich repeat protein 2-like [Solea senegalensis]